MRQKTASYIPAFDGLRAISIMLVFLSHLLYYSGAFLGKSLPGGFGVTIFFYISGFLITRLLLEESKAHNTISLKMFYIRRFLRLYPPLLLMLVLVTSYLLLVKHFIPWQELWSALFYYENYYTAVGRHSLNYYGILWSLSIEEHFYLFYPLIFLLFIHKPQRLLTAIVVLTVVPLVLRCITAEVYQLSIVSVSYTYCLSHCRFDSILYGCLSALLLNSPAANKYLSFTSNKLVYGIALLSILLSLTMPGEYFRQTFRYSMQGLALMILVPPIVYNASYRYLNKALSHPWMVRLGKWSYSIYLFHFVLITYLSDFPKGHTLLYCIVFIVGSFSLAAGSYYFIETPFFRWRKKFGSKIEDEQLPQPDANSATPVILKA